MNEKDIIFLDCTLRDGGYCNDWDFKKKNIELIIEGLVSTKVEIIECGFLTNKVDYDLNKTKYTNLQQLNDIIPTKKGDSEYVVMINVGDYDVARLPRAELTPIDGIRIAFHKTSMDEARDICKIVKRKGYKLYMQPMVTMLYSRKEFIELIKMANEIEPFAFYIVDSFGTMDENDLLEYYSIADTMVDNKIKIGFHSHNNLQNAFSNCKTLTKLDNYNHGIIIDGSIYGMGRGAGNLNSELFLNELNCRFGKNYNVKSLLKIMDEIISRYYDEKPWGYSFPNYLSAIHMVHPNYAKYLTEKGALLLEDMDEIFSLMDPQRAVEYDKEYIENVYLEYMSNGKKNEECILDVVKQVKGKKLLLVAPGASASREYSLIKNFIYMNKPIVISINHEYEKSLVDYIFVSNKRRFEAIKSDSYKKIIATSNISSDDIYAKVDYKSLLNNDSMVLDNAGLMAIKFAINVLEVDEIYLVGYDGYLRDLKKNYESEDMTIFMNIDSISDINKKMKNIIDNYKQQTNIFFLTDSLLDASEKIDKKI